MTEDRQSSSPSSRRLLVEWANDQATWIQSIASEVLSTRAAIEQKLIDSIYAAFLIENDLAPGEAVCPSEIEADADAAPEDADFTIEKLEAVRGVNALAADQCIAFNAGLTILFGENGTGKTGYARVLKGLSGVRTARPILPDVHRPTSSQGPRATVTYRVGTEAATTIDWRGESGPAPFDRVSVFDAPSLHLHVDETLTYVYTPSDLALFPLIDTAIGQIKDRLDSDAAAGAVAANPFVGYFIQGTEVHRLVSSLGASTDMSSLDDLAESAPDSDSRLATAEGTVAALKSSSIAAQVTAARSRRDFYAQMETVAQACESLATATYNEAAVEAARATTEVEALRRELFAAAGLQGESDEVWQKFILGGEAYIEHSGDHYYPSVTDTCIYCRQPLDEGALVLIQRYRDFATDAAQKRVSASRKVMAGLTADLRDLNPTTLLSSIAAHKSADDPDIVLTQAEALIKGIQSVQGSIGNDAVIDESALLLPDDWSTTVTVRRSAAAKLVRELSGPAKERETALAEAQFALDELTDAMQLARRLVEIGEYVASAAWVEQANRRSRQIPALRRSLTTVAKVASEQLVNADFARRFEKESDALRAPKVGLDFEGHKGHAARRKTMPVAKYPSEVLSEGEQTVIGLADFLAEVGLQATRSPVVFDDPVTSLDYRRISEVAKRIASLAEDHQVIVFTHNVWFVAELLALFESDTTRCSYYMVTDDPEKGIVARGTHPRWDTVSSTAGKINNLIDRARKAQGDERGALVETAYSTIRGWCEIVVETELLAGVTQRYRPNVAIGSLRGIKIDHLRSAFDVIQPLFERACRITEAHSQPNETLSVRPTLADLEADWIAAQTARKTYIHAP